MQTVIETRQYLSRAEKLLSEAERSEVVDFLAGHPEAGALIEGTGGVRKVRIALQGRGKSGGARVIYYFHSEDIPVFLFYIYAKNEKANLSDKEKKAMKKIVETIKP